jgi:hypothetical protein
MPWYWGLGFVGPISIRSFFGVGGDENPGFSGFPASKAQIVQAAREAIEEGEADPADLGWLSGNLPDGMFLDSGEVFTALMPIVACRGQDASALVTALPMTAVATGTRMVVGADQTAVLVGSNGRALDCFGPGEHLLSREGAPRAAAESRPLAAGFARSAIDATPVFASTQEVRTSLNQTLRTRSGQSVAIRGSVTVSIGALAEFLAKLGSRPRGLSTSEGGTEITKILGAALEQTVASHELGELTGSGALLEAAVRSGAAQAGLRVLALSFEPVAALSAVDQLTAVQEMQRRALANMPPEMQARVSAQLAQAMERAHAGRGTAPVGPRTGASPGPTERTRTAPDALACPSCEAPNSRDRKFCGNCGKPLSSKRVCPGCGKDAEPGVKFCGSCGASLA